MQNKLIVLRWSHDYSHNENLRRQLFACNQNSVIWFGFIQKNWWPKCNPFFGCIVIFVCWNRLPDCKQTLLQCFLALRPTINVCIWSPGSDEICPDSRLFTGNSRADIYTAGRSSCRAQSFVAARSAVTAAAAPTCFYSYGISIHCFVAPGSDW